MIPKQRCRKLEEASFLLLLLVPQELVPQNSTTDGATNFQAVICKPVMGVFKTSITSRTRSKEAETWSIVTAFEDKGEW